MGMIDGDGWSFGSYVITNEEIDQYAEVTGDRNALHFGPNRIAHGGLLIGKLSAAIWRRYGDNTKALRISVDGIKRPVAPDEPFVIALGPAIVLTGAAVPGAATVDFRITKTVNGREKDVLWGQTTVIPTKDAFTFTDEVAS
ncbi:MAG: MaoC family dehydratase [Candidatus Berkelbacteria bacterium]|nr:MaoC family dehydratase [Candidatus Berkelbacteria bacterium]MCR4308062.1 MaoC family dehydratase [Candidatus Berkelbacteria bacterium]